MLFTSKRNILGLLVTTVQLTAATPVITSFTAGTPGAAPNFATTLTAFFSGGTGVVNPGNLPITSGIPVTVLPRMATRYELTVTNSTQETATLGAMAYLPTLISNSNHTMAIKNGVVYGWGNNAMGYVNGSVSAAIQSPAKVATFNSLVAKSIVTGITWNLCLINNGTVQGWGYEPYYEAGYAYGNGTAMIKPTVDANLTKVLALAAFHYSYDYSLALTNDHNVWAWGAGKPGGAGGYLGANDATIKLTVIPQAISKPVPQLNGHVVSIAAGTAALALADDGTVWAWGRNDYGYLGNGMMSTTPVTTPAQVLSQDSRFPNGILDGIAAVAASSMDCYALRSDGTVWAWGRNFNQTEGVSPYLASAYAIQVQLPAPTNSRWVSAISAGSSHCLALMNDGTVWAWGNNAYGELGDGTHTSNPAPTQVTGLPANIVAIEAGNQCSFAVASDGTIWGWGWDNSYQLGLGSSTPKGSNGIPVSSVPTPTKIPGFTLW